MEKLVCKQCGGSNIQVLAWIDPNTNEYRDEYTAGDCEDTWCDDCRAHVGFDAEEEQQRATIEDFQPGAVLADPEGEYSFRLLGAYMDGAWHARGREGQGDRIIFESEARHWVFLPPAEAYKMDT